MRITTIEALESLYATPSERALRKELPALDSHCTRFVELSPFVVLSSVGAGGDADASPRGGAPGFVKTPDRQTVLLPDAPGNNRLDSLRNIVQTGRVGLLFMVPGVEETLRVNGRAELSTCPHDLAACQDERRVPKLVIRIRVEQAYLHCAKALMRSRLWDPASQVERGVLPGMNRMIADQIGGEPAAETQAEMRERYRSEL